MKEQKNSQMSKTGLFAPKHTGNWLLSAVTLVCEIGDFSAFKRPKQLFAYFGLDPAVRQSGNFSGTDLKMSKRGSRYARRCIYVLAIQSVSLRVDGTAKNPVLRFFYEESAQKQVQDDGSGCGYALKSVISSSPFCGMNVHSF
ncbi:MAG: transposase [Oscillospiraceae bacterium]